MSKTLHKYSALAVILSVTVMCF